MNSLPDDLTAFLSSLLAERLAIITVGVLVLWFANYYVKKTLSSRITNNDSRYRARKASNFFTYALIVFLILFSFSDKLGNIGITLGVASAGIAFALQEVIVSLAGWINIMMTGNISVGQRVKIGGIKGDIIDIGILSTTIMELGDWVDGDLYNGCIVTVANSFVFKEEIHSYSAEYPFLWDEIKIPIRTTSNHALAQKLFETVLSDVCGEYATASTQTWQALAKKYRVEPARVDPLVTLVFDENWVTFTLRYIVDFQKRRTTKNEIYTALLNEIANTNGEVEIATSTLEVSNVTSEGS